MGLPERITNSPQPGTAANLTTLSGNGGSITAAATSFNVGVAAPANLQGQGQTHVLIDAEIIIVDTSTTSGTAWTAVQRGAEGSTAAVHNDGAAIYQILTEEAMANLLAGGIDTKTVSFTAIANMTHVCTGAITSTLPAGPRTGTRVTIVATTGVVTVNAGGTDSITEHQVTGRTTTSVRPGMQLTLKYIGGVWYPVVDTRGLVSDTYCRVNAVATVSAANAYAVIPLDTVIVDPGNRFTTGTHRYTAGVPGEYKFIGTVNGTAANAAPQVVYYKNGAIPSDGYGPDQSGGQNNSWTYITSLAVGDYIQLGVYAGTGFSYKGTMTAYRVF